MLPGPKTFEAIENATGTQPKRDGAASILEFAVTGARRADGVFVHYAPVAIDRVDGALDIARSPAPIDSRMAKRAFLQMHDVLEDLELVGIGCVEFTLTAEQELIVREVTPSLHASGFLTMDACVTGQFEQHLRAVCGLPLGSAELLRPAAMAMVQGDANWAAALAFPQVKIHASGPRGGHLTATAESATLAKQIVRAARAATAPA
jgi:5-(carboxyamino)imidazole ribonucleotide synthase